MKVIFSIPAFDGSMHVECVKSLLEAQKLLEMKGVAHDVHFVSGTPIIIARDMLAAMFLEDDEATDLFFLDADLGFDATAVLKILERDEAIVAGIYPLKQDAAEFPVKLRLEDGCTVGKVIGDGLALLEAELLPTGFMRVKRSVFEQMAAAHPELHYQDTVMRSRSRSLDKAVNFFGMGIYAGQFRTEDYAFCQRWRDLGGQLWVYPDIDFEHVGRKAYAANYHQHLLRLPGGAKSGENDVH